MRTTPTPQQFRTSPSRGRRAFAAALVVLMMGGASVAAAPVTGAGEASLQVVGQFTPSVLPPEVPTPAAFAEITTLLTDSQHRILYTVTTSTGDGDWIVAYDLDTLTPVTQGFRPMSDADPPAPLASHAWYVDEQSGRLFAALADANYLGTSRIAAFAIEDGKLVEVGSVALDPVSSGPQQQVVSMARPAEANYLYLLSAIPSQVPLGSRHIGGTMRVSQVGLKGLAAGTARLSWSQAIPDCAAPTTYFQPPALGYVEVTQSLYVGCVRNEQTGPATPVNSGVGRLGLSAPPDGEVEPSPGAFELFPRPGKMTWPDSVFDPASGRMALTSLDFSFGATAFVFDAPTRSWVGGVSFGNNSEKGIGLDHENGRVYILSSDPATGLVASDIRPTPVSQGDVYPEYFGSIVGAQSPAQNQVIAVDASKKRLFLRYSGSDTWVIAQDMVPAWVAAASEDPDRNTSQIAEEPGKTGRTVSASAAGYGAIVRQVGGLRNQQYNAIQVREPDVEAALGGTRELRGAYLERLAIANGESSASGIRFDRDDANTGKNQAAAGMDWPYEEAHCVDFQGAEVVAAEQDGVRVKCDLASLLTEASGDAPVVDAQVVKVSSNSFEASGRVDEERGSVAQMVSTARGISILDGLLTVGEVRVSAEAVAHGRSGTAASKFDRVVSDVVISGSALCGEQCDVGEIASTINERFAGRLRVEFPEPDPVLAAGSDGGYQALIRQGVGKQVEAQALNEQPADRTEVPGMVVTIYQDKEKTVRTVVYLAGVGVEAHYGIFELPQFPSFDPPAAPASFSGGPTGSLRPAVKGSSVAGPDRQTDAEVVTVIQPAPQGVLSDRPELPPSNPFQEALDRVLDAWRFLMNGPGRVVLLAAMWALLGTPVYLSARRWLLLNRGEVDLGELA